MTRTAASPYACGSSGVPAGEGATWISAITAPPRVSSRARSRALLDHLGDAALRTLGEHRRPLGDPPGDVLLGEAGVGQHLADAAVLEERLRQAQRPQRGRHPPGP